MTKFYETCVGGGAVTTTLLGAQPFLRWLGGKRWLAERVLAELKVSQANVREVMCFDADEDLIAVWEAAKRTPGELQNEVMEMCVPPVTRERYFEVRDGSTGASRAARAAWLNLMSFNGLWRKNKAGRFNMPPDPARLAKPPVGSWAARVDDISVPLDFATFERADVVDSLRRVSLGDAAYVDTPYLPEAATKTSFVGYTDSRDWRRLAAHKAVAEAARDAVERGGRVAISNSASARQLYVDVLGNLPGFRVIEVSNRRSVNSKGDERTVVPEILVVVG